MSDPRAPSPQEVEAALDQLEGQGARAYDAPACDCVRALLTRAEELGGNTAAILVARAHSHVLALTERLARDRTRLSGGIDVIENRLGPQAQLREQLSRGEIVRTGRALRRLSTRPAGLPERVQRTAPSAAQSNDRGARKPSSSPVRPRALAYEDSVAEMVASLAMARAVDVVPEDAGPYNPLRVASDALDRMRELSPFYLTVQLNRLEELATLLALPELPAKVEEKALPRKKRGVLKG